MTLARVVNMREGFTSADDTLPERILREPIFEGRDRGVPLADMLPGYYKLRGWDPAGVPTTKTLNRLSLRT